MCDSETKKCWNCSPEGYDHVYGEPEYNVGCGYSEICALVNSTYDCFIGSRYAVVEKYIDGEVFYRLSTSKAQAMFEDCQNGKNVLLEKITSTPLLICPGKSFKQEEDGYCTFTSSTTEKASMLTAAQLCRRATMDIVL